MTGVLTDILILQKALKEVHQYTQFEWFLMLAQYLQEMKQ
jgi:hypothetical protein